MRIGDILTGKGSKVVRVRPTSTVRDLVLLLRTHNLGAVVVSTDGEDVAGIVSERDVVRRLADGTDFLDGPVSVVMTDEVFGCSPADSVPSVMTVMTERRIRHVPVLDERRHLLGIVSIGDLVKSQISELEFERDQLQGYVSG